MGCIYAKWVTFVAGMARGTRCTNAIPGLDPATVGRISTFEETRRDKVLLLGLGGLSDMEYWNYLVVVLFDSNREFGGYCCQCFFNDHSMDTLQIHQEIGRGNLGIFKLDILLVCL